ncbi:hypothetical protein EOA60_04545 [Mesorhizobium sp. M1A.F.Ca.IN.020.06.1.1]|uniref:hypothetical protein n=1 Tax=unclassified Mesorhizobium TaxID=325217 RepID=UPI000FC9FE8A|nr:MULTISPECIES: hypothetical protein [unclassified Mesorhizobium]RUV84335.1 hypothetical protein EOA51_22195 [Mesorhizobium sp. M1A.F.Ca.IN.020.32.1.1]RUW13872.1 hypothetical protein EOA46_05255 [Mesorhizobium sp. M1A.F.Ca.IN.022.05.2.1]RUW35433.1 hypothetical protein EOA60_04545 [Mesorhizobium sp. M1A.F.Ca.IN.020.06.1.1]RWF81335.1 MAG: hypothetical protein EOQ35_14340 [Mesorhizobium sp.]RWG06171.1 MAG: hypothetical protein EOQ38_02020 [Mesorhizobium sp.]
MVRDKNGEPYSAMVTLNKVERQIVLAYAVPMIYAPGGMGPDRPDNSATVRFGGACFTDVEKNLRASLDAFKAALRGEIERRKRVNTEIRALMALERRQASHADAPK